jgi:hypothetical protein
MLDKQGGRFEHVSRNIYRKSEPICQTGYTQHILENQYNIYDTIDKTMEILHIQKGHILSTLK